MKIAREDPTRGEKKSFPLDRYAQGAKETDRTLGRRPSQGKKTCLKKGVDSGKDRYNTKVDTELTRLNESLPRNRRTREIRSLSCSKNRNRLRGWKLS